MSAGAFLSGLVGAYSTQMLKKMDLEHQQDQDDRKNRIAYLQAAIGSGKLTPDAMNAAIDELGEITGGGGKKGGEHLDILKKLVGKVSKPNTPTPFENRIPGQGGSRPSSFGDIPPKARAASAKVAADTPGHVDSSKMRDMFGSVPTPPTRPKINKTSQDAEDEDIEFEKRRQKEVLGPAEKERDEAQERREKEREQRQDARDQVRQTATDARQKNAQNFQQQMERIRTRAADLREQSRQTFEVKQMDSKAGDALDKQNKAAMTAAYSQAVTSLRQQLAQAGNLLKAREAEAAKRGVLDFWKDAPDVEGAKQDVANFKSAIDFLERQRNAVVSGKVQYDDVMDQALDIMNNGVPDTPEDFGSATLPAGAKVTGSTDLSVR